MRFILEKPACFAFVLLAALAFAQTAALPRPASPKSQPPGAKPYIVKFFVATADPKSTYETGPLHIVYSDGKQVVIRLAPKKKSTVTEGVQNQEGISDPQLAADRQTIGWTERYDNCCTSYAIPRALALYRSGRIIHRIEGGLMIQGWTFLDGGRRVVVVWGTVHGSEVEGWELYDVKTGRMLSEDEEEPVDVANSVLDHTLPTPEWVTQAKANMSNRK